SARAITPRGKRSRLEGRSETFLSQGLASRRGCVHRVSRGFPLTSVRATESPPLILQGWCRSPNLLRFLLAPELEAGKWNACPRKPQFHDFSYLSRALVAKPDSNPTFFLGCDRWTADERKR